MKHSFLPSVTVLLSVYNGEQTLSRCIESVLSQSFTDFEFVIINDGSTDNTESIILSFSDTRIKYLFKNNSGLAASLNHGLKHSLGRYIARIDADDVCHRDRLELQYNFMINNNDFVVCGSAAKIFSIDGVFLKTQIEPENDYEIREKMIKRNSFIHSSTFYLRDVALKVLYDENIFHFFEDYLFFSQLIKYGKAYNFPKPLVTYYVSPFSISSNKMSKFQLVMMKKIISRGYALRDEKEIFENLKNINKNRNLSNYYLKQFRILFSSKKTRYKSLEYLTFAFKTDFFNLNNYTSILFGFYILIFKKNES